MEDQVARYIAAAADLREATREAHQAIKDLRAELKEARAIRGKLPDTAARQIKQAVEEGIGQFSADLAKAIEVFEKAVYRRFDQVAAVLLGDDDKGGENLEEMIMRVLQAATPAERAALSRRARERLQKP